MKILVIGSGAREHALAWKLARERRVTEVICAPGNPGIERIARAMPVELSDPHALLQIAEREHVELTVVGPELPLDRGVVDLFMLHGRAIVGPTRAAAQLESSKVYAKAFMARHGIPTARYRACADGASAYAVIASGELGFPVVVKADGLAAGKGVVVAIDRNSAVAAIRAAMEERQFGEAGTRVVLEECLDGPEASFFVLSDGTKAVPIGAAQDHKRIFDDDKGPNTGGMGAFAPTPVIDPEMQGRIMRTIVEPVIRGLREEGHPYRGFLYVGLMLTCTGPKVIEFNVRFGDPEAQVVIPGIAEDLAPRLERAASGALDGTPIELTPDKHVGVVLASGGYPAAAPVGFTISGLEDVHRSDDVLVFHAGTSRRNDDGAIVTAGGRVLTVVGRGSTFDDAIARAYDGVSRISFEGMQYRRDIGRKVSAWETTGPKSTC